MSQGTLLDHISQWTPQQCVENLDEALPKLITKIKIGHGSDTLDVLRALCEHFLPVCPLDRLDKEIFSSLQHELGEISDKLYNELEAVVKDTSSAVEELQLQLSATLQNCLQLLSFVDEFVSGVRGHGEDLRPQHIHSLPSIVLHLLISSYTHCKNSSQIYGDLLAELTDQLSALFKKAHSLQMNFIGLVDKLSFESPTEEDISDLCEVLQGFHEISMITVSLDVKIMIVLWKTISRLACQHKLILQNKLDIDPMLTSLATDMESSFTYMLQMVNNCNQPDDKTFTKTVKVLGFQMKVLVTIVKEYENTLVECVPSIVKLILTVQSVLPPSVTAITTVSVQQNEVHKQMGIGLEPLISYLIPNRHFVIALTKLDKPEEFKDWAALCMVLIEVAKMLPNFSDDDQCMWINPQLYPEDEPRHPIIPAIFSTIPHCYTELCLPPCLPSIMCRGKPQRSVTMYHHVCAHLCSFVATLASLHFSVLEECLLESVSSSNIHVTLLATDVWCFVARYGSAELCRDHCILLSRILKRTGLRADIQCCHLVNTLKRLFKFIAPHHTEDYVKEFSPETNLVLYSVIPLSVFSNTLQTQLSDQLISTCTAAVNSWLQATTHLLSDLTILLDVYHVLTNISSYMSPSPCTGLVSASTQCLLTLPCTESRQGVQLYLTTAAILHYLAAHTDSMDNTTIYQVISTLYHWVKVPDLHTIIKISMLDFLQALGKIVLPPNVEQVQILGLLPRLFSELLADSNPLVHQVALENFAQFAEETQHETIVPESLQYNDTVQTTVVTYLNSLSNPPQKQLVDYDLLKKLHQLLEGNVRDSQEDRNCDDDDVGEVVPDILESSQPMEDNSEQPPNKRCKTEACTEELRGDCSEALSLLQAGTDQIQSVYRTLGHLPQPFHNQLQLLHTQLAHILQTSSHS